jgi:hypothetical protein
VQVRQTAPDHWSGGCRSQRISMARPTGHRCGPGLSSALGICVGAARAGACTYTHLAARRAAAPSCGLGCPELGCAEPELKRVRSDCTEVRKRWSYSAMRRPRSAVTTTCERRSNFDPWRQRGQYSPAADTTIPRALPSGNTDMAGATATERGSSSSAGLAQSGVGPTVFAQCSHRLACGPLVPTFVPTMLHLGQESASELEPRYGIEP